MLIDLSSLSCCFSPGDKNGGKLSPKELESISNSFDESLHSRLQGLSPASVSLAWLSSAVDVLAFAHSTAKSLVHDLEMDYGDVLSSWYLVNNLKVLDLCNCISAEIEGMCLRCLKLRIVVTHLRSDGNLSKEKIRQARALLADLGSEGGNAYVKSARNIEELIGDLAACIGTSGPQGKVSPVERVVRHMVHTAVFLTVFFARVISATFHASPGVVVRVHIRGEFPWGDSFRTIESAVIGELGHSEGQERKTPVLKELEEVEVCARHVLEAIDEVAALGGGGEGVRRLREMAIGLKKVAEAMSEGVNHLEERVKGLFWTVMGVRTEVMDELTAGVRGRPSPERH